MSNRKGKKNKDNFGIEHGRGPHFAPMPWKLQDAEWATPYTIAVYAALKRYADFGKSIGASPGLARLVVKSHASRSEVRRQLNLLRHHRWIEWKSGKAPNVTNVYVVHGDPDGEYVQDEPTVGSTGTDPRSPQNLPYVLQEPTLGPGGTPTKSHIPEPVPITSTREAEILEIFTYWQKTLGYRSKLDDARRRKIAARLADGFTVLQLKAVVDRTKKDPWRQGENPNRKRYDGIDLIFRNAAKVEEYLSQARSILSGAMPEQGPETGVTF